MELDSVIVVLYEVGGNSRVERDTIEAIISLPGCESVIARVDDITAYRRLRQERSSSRVWF